MALLSVSLQAFLLEGWVPLPELGSPDVSLMTRFSKGNHGHHLLWDGFSLANHNYVWHGHAIWVDRCRIPSPDVELHPLQEILPIGLVLGGDTAHPVNHSQLLCCKQCRSDKIGALVNCELFLCRWWEMSGKWGWAGAHWICPMWHRIFWRKRVYNHHPRISSPKVAEVWHHFKLLPSRCDLSHWSVILWSRQSMVMFKP